MSTVTNVSLSIDSIAMPSQHMVDLKVEASDLVDDHLDGIFVHVWEQVDGIETPVANVRISWNKLAIMLGEHAMITQGDAPGESNLIDKKRA